MATSQDLHWVDMFGYLGNVASGPPVVIGMAFTEPRGSDEPCPCFRVRLDNGEEHYVPISKTKPDEFHSAEVIASGKYAAHFA